MVAELAATGRLEMSLFHTFDGGKIGHRSKPTGRPPATEGFFEPDTGAEPSEWASAGVAGVTVVRTCGVATGPTIG
jgi:hypothetical protein